MDAVVERQYQLALRAALTMAYEAYTVQETRLQTLDRSGQVSNTAYMSMRLAADARAGKAESARALLLQLRQTDPGELAAIRTLLVRNAPEASSPAFRRFLGEFEVSAETPSRTLGSWHRRWALWCGVVAAVICMGCAAAWIVSRWPSPSISQNMAANGPSALQDSSVTESDDRADLYEVLTACVGRVILRVELLLPDGRRVKSPVAYGTGFVVGRDGRILTNKHVVEVSNEAEESVHQRFATCKVLGWDRVFVTAGNAPIILDSKIVFQSAYVDVAMIKVDHQFANVLELASTPRPGETVFAIGFPGVADDLNTSLNQRASTITDEELARQFGAGETPDVTAAKFLGESAIASLTRGVVSAVRKTEVGMFLQTDTFIHRGNSGGPLVNQAGQVVGLNTLGHVGVEGTNFAISSKTLFEELPKEPGIQWPKAFD